MLIWQRLKKYQSFGLIGLTIFNLISCDAPRTQRTITQAGYTQNGIFNNGNGFNNNGRDNNGQNPAVEDPTESAIPQEISHCSWSLNGVDGYALSNKHFSQNESNSSENNISLCQHNSNKLDVYIQLKHPSTDSQVCLLPTYHSGSNQVYVGEPRCLTITNNKKIYKVNLIKNRVGFTQYPVTGVIVMKDKSYFYPAPFYQYVLSPDAYIFCSQWLAQYGDPSYCLAFKNNGHYHYHQF